MTCHDLQYNVHIHLNEVVASYHSGGEEIKHKIKANYPKILLKAA